jgi:hypothetical protein
MIQEPIKDQCSLIKIPQKHFFFREKLEKALRCSFFGFTE